MFITIILFLCYPLLVHLAVVCEEPILLAAAIVALATGILLVKLKALSLSAWLLWLGICLTAIILNIFDIALYALYMPPIILPLLLCYVFGSTLLPGRTPLVTDIGQKARGPLGDKMNRYTLRVTQLWCLFFLLSALFSCCLAVFASDQFWSLYTNVISYLLTGVLFVGEFIYRQIIFDQHDHPNFIDYVKIVVRSQVNKPR